MLASVIRSRHEKPQGTWLSLPVRVPLMVRLSTGSVLPTGSDLSAGLGFSAGLGHSAGLGLCQLLLWHNY